MKNIIFRQGGDGVRRGYSYIILLMIMLSAVLIKLLFPGLHRELRLRLVAAWTGESPVQIIEIMGSELTDEGLYNAIAYAFDSACGGELYPAGNVK